METKTKVILIAVVLIIAVVIIGGGSYLEYYTSEVSTVTVQNIFVDVDNDGDLDLLVLGEVVINNPPFEEPLAQMP